MDKLYSVGETATYCGVSSRTLRYYDNLGIVKPEYVDPETGYRYYSDKQIDRIRLMLVLKELGMSLDEIHDCCHNMNTGKYLQLLRMRKQSLKKEIAKLQKHLLVTERYENDLVTALSSIKDGACFTRILSQIDGYYFPAPGQENSTMRPLLRKLERATGFGMIPGSVLRIISESDLRNGQFVKYSGFVVRNDNMSFDGVPISYPERLYAITYCPAERPESSPYWERLVKFIDENNYEIAGDALKKIIVEKGITDNDSEYISMFCIPIRPINSSNSSDK